MDGEKNGKTLLKILKWMIWGENYHYFRKHPFGPFVSNNQMVTTTTSKKGSFPIRIKSDFNFSSLRFSQAYGYCQVGPTKVVKWLRNSQMVGGEIHDWKPDNPPISWKLISDCLQVYINEREFWRIVGWYRYWWYTKPCLYLKLLELYHWMLISLGETNMSPENPWLDDVFPIELVLFQDTC